MKEKKIVQKPKKTLRTLESFEIARFENTRTIVGGEEQNEISIPTINPTTAR